MALILTCFHSMDLEVFFFFFFLHQLTCVTTDQQNSTVERKHQHSIIVTKALRFQSNLPLSFGGLVFNYLIN